MTEATHTNLEALQVVPQSLAGATVDHDAATEEVRRFQRRLVSPLWRTVDGEAYKKGFRRTLPAKLNCRQNWAGGKDGGGGSSSRSQRSLATAPTRSFTEFISDVIVPIPVQIPHDEYNYQRSATSQSFHSTSKLTYVQLPSLPAPETDLMSALRPRTSPYQKTVSLCGERYTVTPIYGPTPKPMKSGRGRPKTVQQARFDEGTMALGRCRLLKRASEVLPHRVDRMYFMSGAGLNPNGRFSTNGEERERYRHITDAVKRGEVRLEPLKKIVSSQASVRFQTQPFNISWHSDRSPRRQRTVTGSEESAEAEMVDEFGGGSCGVMASAHQPGVASGADNGGFFLTQESSHGGAHAQVAPSDAINEAGASQSKPETDFEAQDAAGSISEHGSEELEALRDAESVQENDDNNDLLSNTESVRDDKPREEADAGKTADETDSFGDGGAVSEAEYEIGGEGETADLPDAFGDGGAVSEAEYEVGGEGETADLTDALGDGGAVPESEYEVGGEGETTDQTEALGKEGTQKEEDEVASTEPKASREKELTDSEVSKLVQDAEPLGDIGTFDVTNEDERPEEEPDVPNNIIEGSNEVHHNELVPNKVVPKTSEKANPDTQKVVIPTGAPTLRVKPSKTMDSASNKSSLQITSPKTATPQPSDKTSRNGAYHSAKAAAPPKATPPPASVTKSERHPRHHAPVAPPPMSVRQHRAALKDAEKLRSMVTTPMQVRFNQPEKTRRMSVESKTRINEILASKSSTSGRNSAEESSESEDDEEDDEEDEDEEISEKELMEMLEKGDIKLQYDKSVFNGVKYRQKDVAEKADKRAEFREVTKHLVVNQETSGSDTNEILFIEPNMSPEQAEAFVKLFDELDVNKDGRIAMDEVQKRLDVFKSKKKTDVKKFIRVFDLNGDRTVDVREFLAVAALNDSLCKQKTTDPGADWNLNLELCSYYITVYKEMFEMADQSKNGHLGLEELMIIVAVSLDTVSGADLELMEDILNSIDRDRSGEIDFVEYLTYIPVFLKLHQFLLKKPMLVEDLEKARRLIKKSLKDKKK